MNTKEIGGYICAGLIGFVSFVIANHIAPERPWTYVVVVVFIVLGVYFKWKLDGIEEKIK